MDWSLPGSSGHGIIQTRIPEWVAISYSRGSSWPRDQTHFSRDCCIGRQILYHWATWEIPKYMLNLPILKYVASKHECIFINCALIYKKKFSFCWIIKSIFFFLHFPPQNFQLFAERVVTENVIWFLNWSSQYVYVCISEYYCKGYFDQYY